MDTTESDFTNLTVGVVGLGLIGGSYAKGLRKLGVKHIIGVDADDNTLHRAIAEKAVDEAFISATMFLKKAELIIFCLPANQMIKFIEENVACFHPQAILTDVAGIKGKTAEKIDELLGPDMDFVPGHPMAGREGSGFLQSDAAIFKKANYILVPQPTNKPEHVELIRRLAFALGCIHVIDVTPEEHDQLIAYTSSLPHVIATALVNSKSMDDKTKYFVAGSFRDGTRVADINAPLWAQLFFENKDNLLNEINNFRDSLTEFTDIIDSGNVRQMITYLQQAAVRRKGLGNGNHTR